MQSARNALRPILVGEMLQRCDVVICQQFGELRAVLEGQDGSECVEFFAARPGCRDERLVLELERTNDCYFFTAGHFPISAPGYLQGPGIETSTATSPALHLRYAFSVPVINHILRGPRLEVRSASDNTLFVAKSYFDGGEDGPQVIGEWISAVMRDELNLTEDVMLTTRLAAKRKIRIFCGLARY